VDNVADVSEVHPAATFRWTKSTSINVSVKFINGIMQFRFTMRMNCRESTYYIKAIYIVGHEEANTLLLLYIVRIM
jgi:hypothetical protein